MAEHRGLLERIGLRGGQPDLDRHGIALTASAQAVNLSDRTEASRTSDKALDQAWHADAWSYRRNIGEVGFGQEWLATACSRMRLYLAGIVPGAKDPVHIDEALTPPAGSGLDPLRLPAQLVADAQAALDALTDVDQLLARATVNMETVGEWRLVGYLDEQGRERWECRSKRELQQTEYGWLLRGRPGRPAVTRPVPTYQGGELLDPRNSYVTRIWRPDAEWMDLSDCALSRVLDRCEEVMLLGRKLRNAARSRIPAGVFALPSEVEFAPAIAPDGTITPAEPFENVLTLAFSSAISDETSPSALVPIIVTAPADKLDAMRRVDLGRGSDEQDSAERTEVLTRVLQGLDFPPEIVTGFGDVKYANARTITDSTFRDHVEPKVLTHVHSLTTAYLRPRLLSLGHPVEQVEQLCLWYDPSDLVSNPDQGADAQAVYDAGELSSAALRRYRGFDEADAPTPEDRAFYIATRGKGTPAGNAVQNPVTQPGQQDPPTDYQDQPGAAARGRRAAAALTALTAAADPAPQLSALGDRLLRIDLRVFSLTQAAADGALRRALERAASRARSKARADRAAVADVPLDRLVAHLGPDGIARLGLTDEQLLDGDPFGSVVDRFDRWCAAGFEQALKAVCQTTGQPYEQTVTAAAGDRPLADRLADLTPAEQRIAQRLLGAQGLDLPAVRLRGAADRQLAGEQLRRRLTELAHARLYDPASDDDDLTVPPGIVRGAMARAGGAGSSPLFSGVDDDGRPTTPGNGLPGGLATGVSVREQSARAGLAQHAYSWTHGAAGHPFDPHLQLDGQVFADQSDRRLLKDPAVFPRGTTSWFPGDHPGCSCWTEFLYDDPYAGLSASAARSVRAAQQARDEQGRFVARRDHPDDTPGGTSSPRPRQ